MENVTWAVERLKAVEPVQAAALLGAAAGLWVLAVFARWWRRVSLLGRLPSPSGAHLIMGHAKAISNNKHHRIMCDWTDQLGPMYVLKVLWLRVVVVTDPVLLHTLLKKSPDIDKSQKVFGMLNSFNSEKGHPVMFTASSHSQYWKNVRKGVSPAFSPKSLRNAFSSIQRTNKEVVQLLAKAAADGEPLDIDRLLLRQAMDVLSRSGFGVDLKCLEGFNKPPAAEPEDETDVFNLVQECVPDFNELMSNPLKKYKFWDKAVKRNRRFWKVMAQRMEEVAGSVREAGARPENATCLGAYLLNVIDPLTGKPLGNDHLVPEMRLAFANGTDATAHTAAWTIYLISTHPEVEAKVCAELASLGLLATRDNPNPRQVEFDDLNKLTYLRAANNESMRLKPVTSDGTFVEFDHDVELGGYTIPGKTLLWLPFYSTHNSKLYWDQPEHYLPERWLVPGCECATPGGVAKAQAVSDSAGAHGGQGFAAKGKGGVHVVATPGVAAAPAEEAGEGNSARPVRFLPFSVGPRDCIGQNQGRTNNVATLATLLGRYHFQLPKELEGPGGIDEKVDVVLQPANGLPMYVIPRASIPAVRK